MMSQPAATGSAALGLDPDPIRASIAGIDVVTIPLDHYAELLACRRLVAEHNLRRRIPLNVASRVDRDPEVATYLIEHAGGLTLKELYTSCLAKFGPDRAPSRSSVQRFRRRLGR